MLPTFDQTATASKQAKSLPLSLSLSLLVSQTLVGSWGKKGGNGV
jgi:hypothetical protein